uniref:NTR domain-containing protein n=1 Tax=Strongyloides papillosus TaxID=174720 RepID=A0A0N5BE02_STREA
MICLNFNHLTEGCDCMINGGENDYCFSDWISHVKILSKDVAMVDGTDEYAQEPEGVKYTVNHLQVFKKPSNMTDESLSTLITTPSNTAMCGVDFLNVSDSYILSGAFNSDHTLSIYLCGGLKYNYDKVDSIRKLMKYKNEMNCP